MADLRDYTKKNTVFVGTDGIRLPKGNNAQRTASSNVAGTMRFNTDIDGIETYTSAGWRPLAAPPSINTVTPGTFNGESGTEFIINGEGFTPDAQVYFVTANSTALLAATISYYSAVQVRATTPRTIKVEEEPISVRIVQQSGTATKINCIDAGGVPSWITTGGALGSIFGANTVNVYVSATDPEGTAVTYQLASGSLPGGLSLSANGLIQGLASSVLANTLYNFVIKANDTVNNNTDRSFSYTVLNRRPVINTAAGSLGTVYSGNAVPSATISAYDPDGGQLTYSVDSGSLPLNTGLGSANGVIQGTPIVVTTNTTYTFSITATDEGSLTASNTYTYTVLNRPPLWNTAATLTSYNAETFTPITVNAYDPDGGVITYSLTSGSVPSGLTFVTANATITGTASDVVSNTTSTFTVTATDPGSDANARTFSLTITPIIDAQFSNTVLLLKTAGNTVIADASVNNLPITVYGDARASNFNPFGNLWSNYFGATNPTGFYVSQTNFAFGTGDFTVEGWVYFTGTNSNNNYPMVGQGWGPQGGNPASYKGWLLTLTNLNNIRWYRYDGSEYYYDFGIGSTLTQGTWYHVAVSRSGTNLRAFLNGNQVGTTQTVSVNYTLVSGSSGGSDFLYVGKDGGGGAATIPGYLSNIRVCKSAVYTANFIPSTTSLTTTSQGATNCELLTCQNNRFKDNSNNNLSITLVGSPKVISFSPFSETDTSNGSMYFDGTGDYLLVDNRSEWNLSTFDWTIEFWAYPTAASQSRAFCDKRSVSNQYSEFPQISLESGVLKLYVGAPGGSSWLVQLTGPTILPFSWSHIAAARSGTNYYLLVNGTIVATGTGSGAQYSGSNSLCIASAATDGTNPFTGYMSNFRLVVNTAIYTANTTAPSTLLSNVAGTKILTLQNRLPHNNHTFQDSSNNKHLITRYGNATQGTFTPFSAEPGKWSNYFNGSSGVRFADNAAFQFGSNAFTVEGWFNVASTPSNDASIISKWVAANDGNSSWMVDFQSSNLSAAISIGGSVTRITGTSGIPLGVWNHFALVRSGSPGTLSLFLNGNRIATGTPTGSLVDDSNPVGIGVRGGTDSYYLTGYLTNIHVVNGTALYDPILTTHTIPTGPLSVVTNTKLLTCQNNRFIDNSTANSGAGFGATTLSTPSVQVFSPFAPTSAYNTATVGGSYYGDGSGDYLINTTSNLQIAASTNFTLEFWIYRKSSFTSDQGRCLFAIGSEATNRMQFTISGAAARMELYAGSLDFNGGTIPLNAWTHVAYVRSGSTITIYINGVSATSATFTGVIGNTGGFVFGANPSISNYIDCPVSGLRLINGRALYTSNFTPPTAPLTSTYDTSLLLNFTDAAIIDYTGKNVIETMGDAKSNNSVYKFIPGSMYFDGTGDVLTSYTDDIKSNFSIGSNYHKNFTVEAWINPTSASGDQTIASYYWYENGSAEQGWLLYLYNGVYYWINSSSGGGNVNGGTTVANTWTHIAGVLNNGTMNLYVNGISVGTPASIGTGVNSNSRFVVGARFGNNAYNGRFTGTISDLRISKMVRYTANFTPPTRSFPTR